MKSRAQRNQTGGGTDVCVYGWQTGLVQLRVGVEQLLAQHAAHLVHLGRAQAPRDVVPQRLAAHAEERAVGADRAGVVVVLARECGHDRG